MSQILSGTYHSTVKLGVGSIGDTVTVTGTIQIGFYGGAGIYAASSIANAYVLNDRTIVGGSNGGTVAAGAGVYLGASGTVVNATGATIQGGHGGNYSTTNGFAGGIGVDLNGGGVLTNHGAVGGGNGGNAASGSGGTGGDGFLNTYGPATVTNDPGATITGGDGGQGTTAGGNGGVGVELDGGGTLVNGSASATATANIFGGNGGIGGNAIGGIGVLLDQHATAMNFGVISGGGASGQSSVTNGDIGGTGLLARGMSTVANAGLIEGGAGSYAGTGGPTQGGLGVYIAGNSALSNTGSIIGGAGGSSGDQYSGEQGGIGLFIDQSAGTVSNSGFISGGIGGAGYYSGGYGGIGVFLEDGATLTNTGFIGGGVGGQGSDTGATTGSGGSGGNGVYLDGGTLINAGTITGGAGGFGSDGAASMGNAVQFGALASTLVVDAGATFDGNVVADAAVADVLELAGTATGTFTGLGTQFTGFRTVTIKAGANWILDGSTNTATGTETIDVDGSLGVDGDLLGQAAARIVAGGELQIDGGEVILGKLSLAGGKLACGEQAKLVIGKSVVGAAQGSITIGAGAAVSGFGTIATYVAGSGTLAVSGGTLLLQGGLTTTVVATIAAKDTLDLSGGGTLGSISGAGTLKLDGTSPYVIVSGKTPGAGGLTIDPKVSLSGYGTFSGALDNAGSLTASGGTLSLRKAAKGNGNFAAAKGATLDFADGLTTAGTLSGAGTLRLDAASTLDAGAHLLAAHVLENANITLGTGTSLTNAAGNDFAIDPGVGGTIELAGAAGDTFTNASSFACSGTGTAYVDVAFINSQIVSAGSGRLAFLGSVTNTGTMSAGTGVLTLSKEALGSGTLTIGQAGTLILGDGAATGQSVQFDSLTGFLDLGNPLTFHGFIDGFGAKDTIDLLNTASTSLTFAHGTLTVDNGTAAVAKLAFAGSYTQSDFAIGSDGHGGTLVTFV